VANPPAPSSTPGTDAGPLLVVLSGPSGAGKDSVLAELRERGLRAHFTVTNTTRPQRETKPEDRAFLSFLTEDEFERLQAGDGLLEHAVVYGYRYGVPKAQVREALAKGLDVIMRVDVQGAATIKRLVPPALLIFLMPPSIDNLEARLRARGLDSEETIARRLAAAARELDEASKFDYTVVNQDGALDATVERVLEIMESERRRPGRKPVVV